MSAKYYHWSKQILLFWFFPNKEIQCVSFFSWEYFDLFVKYEEGVAKITGSTKILNSRDEHFSDQINMQFSLH